MKIFALGQDGPDSLRLDASQILSRSGILKSGEMVNLWLEGEWRPIIMMGFQISYEPPEKPTLNHAAQHLMKKATYALQEEKGAEAETHLRKALEIQRDEPGLLNNLAVALSMQGKYDEAETIAEEIPARFPDYFFGQVIAVRKAIQAGELEKAKPILDTMMQKQELHVTEFGAMCACQIDLMIEDNKPEGAFSSPSGPNSRRFRTPPTASRSPTSRPADRLFAFPVHGLTDLVFAPDGRRLYIVEAVSGQSMSLLAFDVHIDEDPAR